MGLGWFDAIAPQVLAVSTGIQQGNMMAQEEQRKRQEEAIRNKILAAQLARLEAPEPAGEWKPTTREEAIEYYRETHPEDGPEPIVSEWAKAGFPDTPEGRAAYIRYQGEKARAAYPDRFRAPAPKEPSRVEANDEAEGLAVLNSVLAQPGQPRPAGHNPAVAGPFSEAFKAIRRQNPTMSPGQVSKQAMEGLRKGRPDLFKAGDPALGGYAQSYADVLAGGAGALDPEVVSEEEIAPPPVPATQATPATAPKRIISKDQADYLQATGQWDPSRYEVR